MVQDWVSWVIVRCKLWHFFLNDIVWANDADGVVKWITSTLHVVCFRSVQLEKERQQREDAEKEKRELEDRLKKYEDEFEKAKLG